MRRRQRLQLDQVLHTLDDAGGGDAEHVHEGVRRPGARHLVHVQLLDDDVAVLGEGGADGLTQTTCGKTRERSE